MKHLFIIAVLFLVQSELAAQAIGRVPDSLRQQYDPSRANPRANLNNGSQITELNYDSLVKIKLVKLALKYSSNLKINDATTRIAEANYDGAKKSWLSSVSFGANINEFVVSNSEAASFFPKYNLGAMVPLDIFTRTKTQKKVAAENINISNLQKEHQSKLIKAEVLLRYENYKEKKEVVNLQRSYMEYDLLAYESAKQAYSDGDIQLEIMNKAHQIYITEKSKMATMEKELNVAIIQLEELIGVPVEEAIVLP